MLQNESLNPDVRRVVCVAFDAMSFLELASLHKVFWEAERLTKGSLHGEYSWHTASLAGGLVETRQGVKIDTVPLARLDDCGIHTLILPGDAGSPRDTVEGAHLMIWLARTLPRVRRVIAAGRAIFMLAKNGVLKGKNVAIHCSLSEALRNDAEDVHVDGCSLFCGDDEVWTYAGALSAIDLALELVEVDYGRDASLRAARHLAVFVRRPGKQSQLSEMLVSQMDERDAFNDLHVWIQANRDARVTVEQMAERVAMSARNFSRVYKRNIGCTPAKAIERFRLETSDVNGMS